MALLFVREVTGKDWIEPREWPEAPDLPAERLRSLNTINNDLSGFSCESEHLAEARVRIAVALRAKREIRLRDFDCVVVPIRTLNEAGFEIEKTPGKSADRELNKEHHDIKRLTARRLVRLLEVLTPATDQENLPRIESVPRLDLARALLVAADAGQVELAAKVRQEALEAVGGGV